MSIEPERPILESAPAPRSSGHPWRRKLAAVLGAAFCFLLGLFLIVFPWVDLWDVNILGSFGPQWQQVWTSSYLRGAVSGLGVVNVFISLLEAFRLRRFSIE